MKRTKSLSNQSDNNHHHQDVGLPMDFSHSDLPSIIAVHSSSSVINGTAVTNKEADHHHLHQHRKSAAVVRHHVSLTAIRLTVASAILLFIKILRDGERILTTLGQLWGDCVRGNDTEDDLEKVIMSTIDRAAGVLVCLSVFIWASCSICEEPGINDDKEDSWSNNNRSSRQETTTVQLPSVARMAVVEYTPPSLQQVPSVHFMEPIIDNGSKPLSRTKSRSSDVSHWGKSKKDSTCSRQGSSNSRLSTLDQVSSAASLVAARVSTSAANLVGLANVGSSASIARLSAAVKSLTTSAGRRGGGSYYSFYCDSPPLHVCAVSASAFFCDMDLVAALKLSDVATLFRYVMESGNDDFDGLLFVSNLSYELKEVLLSMDAVASESRGMGVRPFQRVTTVAAGEEAATAVTNSSGGGGGGGGHVDALLFCAVMRIFAEWRLVRQVPEGYKAYAVGLGLAKRDVVANIAKVEARVHSWIEQQRERNDDENIIVSSPSIQQLLQDEVDSKLHPKQPKLKEKSAAMGVLWMLRQADYQNLCFSNLLQVPTTFKSVDEAVASAYSEALGVYHGWIVQKTFQYTLKGAPPVDEILRVMFAYHVEHIMDTIQDFNPMKFDDSEPAPGVVQCSFGGTNGSVDGDELQDEVREAPSLMVQDEETIRILENQISKEEGLPIQDLGKVLHNEWDKFAQHVGGEWNKFIVSAADHVGHSSSLPDRAEEGDNSYSETQASSAIRETPSVQSNFQVSESLVEKNEGGVEYDFDEPITMQMEVSRNGRTPPPPSVVLEGEELDRYVAKEITKEAFQQIQAYLSVTQPALVELKSLMTELNMNDPTKV